MPQRQGALEIKLPGHIHPKDLDIADLAEILKDFRAMLVGKMLAASPEMDARSVHFALVAIKEGSVAAAIETSDALASAAAMKELAPVFASGDLAFEPYPVREPLRRMRDVLKRLGARAEFRWMENGQQSTAVFDPHVQPARRPSFEGQTVLYGELLKIGGSPPRAYVRMPEGRIIACKIPKKVARKLSARLYEPIGVMGIATWGGDDLSVIDFKIQEMIPYEPGSITEAFSKLARIAGDAFKDEARVRSFLEELRGD